MVADNKGYYVMQVIKQNQIIISLPQTISTLTNTIGEVSDRRVSLTENEEATLLLLVKSWLEKEVENGTSN